jgi:hypothetical protein
MKYFGVTYEEEIKVENTTDDFVGEGSVFEDDVHSVTV